MHNDLKFSRNTSHKEKARFKRLQEHDTLSTVDTGQQDENGSGGEWFADLGGSNFLNNLALPSEPKSINCFSKY